MKRRDWTAGRSLAGGPHPLSIRPRVHVFGHRIFWNLQIHSVLVRPEIAESLRRGARGIGLWRDEML